MEKVLMIAGFFLVISCAASMKEYRRQLRRAVVLAPVDQAKYKDVYVSEFLCSSFKCSADTGRMAQNRFGIELSRIGFTVHDEKQVKKALLNSGYFEEESSSGGSAEFGVKMDETGFSVKAGDGSGMKFDVKADASGFSFKINTLPKKQKMVLYNNAGIKAYVTGEISISKPDSITNFRDVTVYVKCVALNDGSIIWHGKWTETATDDDEIESAINRALENLAKSLAVNLTEFQGQ